MCFKYVRVRAFDNAMTQQDRLTSHLLELVLSVNMLSPQPAHARYLFSTSLHACAYTGHDVYVNVYRHINTRTHTDRGHAGGQEHCARGFGSVPRSPGKGRARVFVMVFLKELRGVEERCSGCRRDIWSVSDIMVYSK